MAEYLLLGLFREVLNNEIVTAGVDDVAMLLVPDQVLERLLLVTVKPYHELGVDVFEFCEGAW